MGEESPEWLGFLPPVFKMVKIELDENDKKALEKCMFVVYDGRISFPQGANYTIKRLEQIIREAKKMKIKKGQVMCGLMLRFPYSMKIKGIKKGKKWKKQK